MRLFHFHKWQVTKREQLKRSCPCTHCQHLPVIMERIERYCGVCGVKERFTSETAKLAKGFWGEEE